MQIDFSKEFKFFCTRMPTRDFFAARPFLRGTLVALSIFQMLAFGLAATNGGVQIAIEIALAALLAIAILLTPILLWELLLVGCLVGVTILSFFTESLLISAINAKQNTLGVLALIVFSRMRYEMRAIWWLAAISVALVYIGRYHLSFLLPYLHYSAYPEFNASRFGGLFLNAHFNAFFLAVIFISLMTRSRLHWVGPWVMYITASRFIAIAYLAQMFWRLLFRRFVNYWVLTLLGFLIWIAIIMVEPYLGVIIDQSRFNSLYIILYQIGNFEYYTRLFQLLPGGHVVVPLHESFNIPDLIAKWEFCATWSHISVVYGDPTRGPCVQFFPHHGHNEIGLFALTTHMGIVLGSFYLGVLLRLAPGYRILILISLVHNFFILSPLVIYLMTNYRPLGPVLFWRGQVPEGEANHALDKNR